MCVQVFEQVCATLYVGGQFSEVSSHRYKARFLLFQWLWWVLLAGQPTTAPGICSRLCLQSWRRCLPPKSAVSLGCRDETLATRLVWLMLFNHLNHLHSPDNKTPFAFLCAVHTCFGFTKMGLHCGLLQTGYLSMLCFIFGSTDDQTQGLVYARQVLTSFIPSWGGSRQMLLLTELHSSVQHDQCFLLFLYLLFSL